MMEVYVIGRYSVMCNGMFTSWHHDGRQHDEAMMKDGLIWRCNVITMERWDEG